MRHKRWSLRTSILLATLAVGCSGTPISESGKLHADSVAVALTSRVDSLENELAMIMQRYEGISSELVALRDSIANAGMASHKHPIPTIGGEAKGDPIRPGDGHRKEVK